MTRSIAWDKVTHADVLRAIQEYDRQGLSGFSLRTDSLPPRLMIWSGTDAVTRRKQSWARLMSSPRANALPPVISRAGRPAPSRCSESLDSPSSPDDQPPKHSRS